MTEFIEQDLTGAHFERVALRRDIFTKVSLAEARMRSVDLSGVQVRGALFNNSRLRGVELVNVEIYGELHNVVVNGVDIAPLVEAELDRRMPERAKMRPDDVTGSARRGRSWNSSGRAPSRGPELAGRGAAPQRRRRVVVHPDPAPPQLRQRGLGGSHGARRRVALAPARPTVGRGTRLGRSPLGPRRAAVARRGAHGPARAPGQGRTGHGLAHRPPARFDGDPHRAGLAAARETSPSNSAFISSSTRSGNTGSTPNAT